MQRFSYHAFACVHRPRVLSPHAGAYLRLPPADATKAFASLAEKGYLKVGVITEADCLYVFTLEGREAAKKLQGIVNGCAQADKYGV